MNYQVRVSPAARKQLRRIDAATQQRIVTAFRALGTDPRPAGYRALKGQDLYRIRVGDYRVLYAIHDDVLEVLVVKIGHRRDVYR
jgi:mRNA interferase RelE/StbE